MSTDGSASRTLILALTMHRSGSSVTTNVLQALGASLGPFELTGALPSNKYGHFESRPLVLLDREVHLKAQGYCDEELYRSPELMERMRRSMGDWEPDAIDESLLARGRDLLGQLVRSGDVVAFKDPRVPLIWAYWKRLLAELSGVRIVLLFLVRTPHEIAMSVFRRSHGEFRYEAALDACAAHLRQMSRIRDAWKGDRVVVRFEEGRYFGDLEKAAPVCGLRWSEDTARRVVDPAEWHFRPAVVLHPAQELYDRLAGEREGFDPLENQRMLRDDADQRESLLRKRMHDWRAKSKAQEAEIARLSAGYPVSREEFSAALAGLQEEVSLLRASAQKNVGARTDSP